MRAEPAHAPVLHSIYMMRVFITSNENEMSDGGRGRALVGVEVWKSSQKVERTPVRCSLHRLVRCFGSLLETLHVDQFEAHLVEDRSIRVPQFFRCAGDHDDGIIEVIAAPEQ
jgi:hypothetical protein